MKTSATAFAVLLLASASTAALAQTRGTTSGTTMAPAVTNDRIEARRGPEQREMELVQTSLLNQFGHLGFSELRSIRREGADYVAEVTTNTGQPATVVIDARQVRSDMAAAGQVTGATTGTTGTSGAAGSTLGGGASMAPPATGSIGTTTPSVQPMTSPPLTSPQSRVLNRGSTGTSSFEGGTPTTGPGVGTGMTGSGASTSAGPTPLSGQGQSVMGDRTGGGTAGSSPLR